MPAEKGSVAIRHSPAPKACERLLGSTDSHGGGKLREHEARQVEMKMAVGGKDPSGRVGG